MHTIEQQAEEQPGDSGGEGEAGEKGTGGGDQVFDGSPKAPSSRAAVGPYSIPATPMGKAAKLIRRKSVTWSWKKPSTTWQASSMESITKDLGRFSSWAERTNTEKGPDLAGADCILGIIRLLSQSKRKLCCCKRRLFSICNSGMRDPYRSAGLSFRRQLPVPQTLKRIGPYSVLAGAESAHGDSLHQSWGKCKGFLRDKNKV